MLAQKQETEAQEQRRKLAADAEAKRLAGERAQAERIAAGEREKALQAEQTRIEQARLDEVHRQNAARLLSEQHQREAQELARQQLEQVQAKQLAEARAQADRERFEVMQAEQHQQQVAKQVAERAAAARVLQEQALAKELDVQRLVLAQQEAARLSLLQAQTVVAELQRVQAQQAEKERHERVLQAKAESARLELAQLAEQKKQEVELLAAQKKIQLALVNTAPTLAKLIPTPYFKGYDEHQRQFSVGDEAHIQVIDMFTKASKPLVMKVTQVDLPAERVIYNDGEFSSDLMGNTTSNKVGSMSTPRQFYPADLMVGKKWQTRFKQSRPNGTTYTFQYDLKVVAKETVTVPAGSFEAYKIEARGFNMELSASLERNIWVAPGVNADIAHEIIVRLRNGRTEQADRQELVSISQARR